MTEEKHGAGIQEFNPDSKTRGGGVLVWGCMSAEGVGNLHFIEGITNHVM